MKKILTVLNILFVFSFVFLIKVQAKDFELIINRDVYVNEENKIQIIETHTVKNNSSTEFISKKNVETFQINHIKTLAGSIKQTVDSAILKIDGKQVQFTTEYSNETATITVEYPRAIGTNDQLTFSLEYYNFGLLEKTGTLYDLYISGLSKGSVLKTEKQDMFYDTNIYIKKGVLPEINFVLPKPISSNDQDRPGYIVYRFNLDSLLGNSVWMQFGKEQLYKFNITQKAVATLGSSLGLNNEYKIIIPRDIASAELYQKVYIDKMFPIPTKTEYDSEGNFFAYFNIPSTDNEEITIEGYVQVGLTGKTVSEENSGKISDYDQAKIKDYLNGAVYWEVSNPEIQAKAAELKGNETNVYKIIQSTYNFVINKINYSDIKRFGLNNRQGALETLHDGSGVCMEYSDLFLTLLRAQGIPARAIFGYGYDPLINNTSQEAHQWVQVLIPSTNTWLDVDINLGLLRLLKK